MKPVITQHIRAIHDYPKAGIVFRDITPLLADGPAFQQTIDHLVERYREAGITKVVGIEARGFIFATALAYALGIGFVPLRKPGKLPGKTLQQKYQLEYGDDALELHADALTATDKVLIIDDLLATGGTVLAGVALVEQAAAQLHECAFIITLNDLPGVQRLNDAAIPYYTLCEF
ncbi:adenine phosphoribosyltransferase [Pseudidiomarina terrestris]|uniref:Adenine phosphoribosyltransferase n=1 Tax=Pseudidiomarina terrestris TaxID=2820060 RepID=A0ABT8MG02_9GAMM|nr:MULTISPECIES: adenine phosphoribosyltransferase [unclassified Pseudidiomarina]MDN7127769.1 adenine phosphoribosyltransferase [Pseudidiomarina sp. 1APR75-33.1]MDN7128876.1 adenine phosphoribosyltransferase [Pseudidiomarina sp. 1APR75-15]MDN7134861.1 adenine phosphoribosyltransferase [Pseudidiomarina sp. 1ASP75-5]MEA3587351.1 adenine phosphoribosyltransferase [Pseudidiomarina sp. 1APP75-27a]